MGAISGVKYSYETLNEAREIAKVAQAKDLPFAVIASAAKASFVLMVKAFAELVTMGSNSLEESWAHAFTAMEKDGSMLQIERSRAEKAVAAIAEWEKTQDLNLLRQIQAQGHQGYLKNAFKTLEKNYQTKIPAGIEMMKEVMEFMQTLVEK